MRGCFASRTACHALSMSPFVARARPQMMGALAAIRWVAHLDRDAAHGFQIVGRGGGESRFDDIDAEPRQRARHFHLLGGRHRRARRLLAVA